MYGSMSLLRYTDTIWMITLTVYGSEKGSKSGNLRADLVEFLVLKVNLLVGTQCAN